jgi:hypothetical protein
MKEGEGSRSFLKKRTKELLPGLRRLERAAGLGHAPMDRSFLVLFFKKERLSSASLEAFP